MQKLHGSECGLYAVCLSTCHCWTFIWSSTLALFSSRMIQSVCYSIWHYSLHHLYCYVIWSPEAGVCYCQQRQYHFSGRCLWLTTLHLGCSGVSAALCTCLISCRHQLNDDAMSCHPPRCVAGSHLYHCTSASVPVIWCVMLLVSFVLSRLGGHSDDTLWYPGSNMMTCTVSSHMKILWQGKKSLVFVLTHVILDLRSVLWINP